MSASDLNAKSSAAQLGAPGPAGLAQPGSAQESGVQEGTVLTGASPTDAVHADGADAHITIDASGLKCPLPILRAKKALSQLNSGELLAVITTDINAVKDFQAFCRQTGNTLISQISTDAHCTHLLRRR